MFKLFTYFLKDVFDKFFPGKFFNLFSAAVLYHILFLIQPCKVLDSKQFLCPTPDMTDTVGDDKPTEDDGCKFQVQNPNLQNKIQVGDLMCVKAKFPFTHSG